MSGTPNKVGLVQDDPWLEPYEEDINERLERFNQSLAEIEQQHGSLEHFASAYRYLGFNYDAINKGWWYREWAPGAHALFLIGDFNQWDRTTHPLIAGVNGVWEIFLPDTSEGPVLRHQSAVKVHVIGANGSHDRIPPYIQYAVQDEESKDFTGQVWAPSTPYAWTDADFKLAEIGAPVIYECHVGMGQEKEGVGTYREFADVILPRIKALGYNCLQVMAIQEHPYYGSFGYHVSNFFAASSRFGTPDDLKYMVNKAHEMGLAVIMDLVHSHAVKNFAEGLSEFDGTDHQYFHAGARGYHSSWDSLLFNYGKREVQQFLLSNVAFWLEEYHFDGFRFDGVTSMMYFHHGHFVNFDHYDKYFKDGVEWDALVYLQLANELIHRIKPAAISIAEDMSGMPGLCRQMQDGGIGFDYRLGMGIPDYWIKILKHKRDEDWDIHEIWNVLANRRYKEKTVAYAESHDQALVGDKTLAFWLMDKEMYWHMQVNDDNPLIDRGIALHKLIRLITLMVGGEAYLNFMGNEFGHPEWVDFPREGNNWSHKYARRQWSLADHEELKYKYLLAFDKAMLAIVKKYDILEGLNAQQLNMDTVNNVIAFERKNLVVLINFHPEHAIPDYKFWVPKRGDYKIIMHSDMPEFGGFDRLDTSVIFSTNEDQQLSVYATNRTAIILERIS